MAQPGTISSVFSPELPLVLVGAGKMGGALLKGWLEGGLDPSAVLVVDPSPPDDSIGFLGRAGVAVHPSVPANVVARVIVIAVKPQVMDAVLPGLRPLVGRETIAISVAAGKTLQKIGEGLGPCALIRTIPNTPAQVGRGITAAVANPAASEDARKLATTLLEAVGDVVWVDDERLIDAVTAVSGSGPAYVFLLTEALAEAAIDLGLPPDTADRLARATVAGAGELLYRSDLPPDVLRKNVTSPNGTTAAALAILMGDGGLSPLMKRAVAAARRRSEELSG